MDRTRPRRARAWMLALALITTTGLLTGCGGAGGTNTEWGKVVWGQDAWSAP